MKLVFNSWQLWNAYNLQNDLKLNDKLYTSSPGLYEAELNNHKISDLSAHINLEEGNELGETVLKWTLKWQKIIDDTCQVALSDLQCGKIISKSLHHLMVSLSYHYLELSKIRQADEKIVIPYFGSKQEEVLDSKCVRMLVTLKPNYYAFLAQHPMLFDELKAVNLDTKKNELSLIAPNNKVRISLFERIRMQILKSVSMHSQIFKWQIWSRFYGNERIISFIRVFWNKKIKIFLFSSNDILTGYMGKFFWNQNDVRKIDISDAKLNVNKYQGKNLPIEKILCDSLQELHKDEEWLLNPLSVAALRIDRHINTFLLPMHESLCNKLNTSITNDIIGKKAVFLTNGLYSSIENMFGELIRQQGIPVINFQHGGIGLLERYKSAQLFSDMTRSDGYVCYNEYEKLFYKKLTNDQKTVFFVQGAQYQHAIPFYGLARWLMRKEWNIHKQSKVLLYAPTRFKDGHLWLPHGIRDMQYWHFMKKLVMDVFSNTSYECFIKYHQKGLGQLEANNDLYRSRKQPLESLQLPENIKLRSYPDLRFCRTVADLIIIDRATSTIGWVLAANIPLIYLNLSSDPLTTEVRKEMEKALFVFDIDNDCWDRELRQFLELPYEKILKLWNEKEIHRKHFSEHYVIGSKKDYLELNNWIIEQTKKIGNTVEAKKP